MEFASSPFDKPKAPPIPEEEVIVLSLEEYVQYLLLRVLSGCPTTPEHWYTGLAAVAALEYAQQVKKITERVAQLEAQSAETTAALKRRDAEVDKMESKTDHIETQTKEIQHQVAGLIRRENDYDTSKKAYEAKIDELTRDNDRVKAINALLATRLGIASPAVNSMLDALAETIQADEILHDTVTLRGDWSFGSENGSE